MTVAILSILLFIVSCVAAGLWVWAGGVHSDYLEAKWEADYYYDKANGFHAMLFDRDRTINEMKDRIRFLERKQ